MLNGTFSVTVTRTSRIYEYAHFFFFTYPKCNCQDTRGVLPHSGVCALEASGFDITPVPAEYGTTVAFQIICDDIQLWEEEEEEPIGDWRRTFRFAVLRCLTVFLLSIRLL